MNGVECQPAGYKSAGISRPLRIEYPGAVYHLICRGNNRQKIFKEDLDAHGIWRSSFTIANSKRSRLWSAIRFRLKVWQLG